LARLTIRPILFAAALAATGLSACSNSLNWSRDYHTVRSGETVFSIAQRYALQPADLIRWNRLGDGTLIYSGQRLRLTPPPGAATGRAPVPPASPPPAWRWPVAGPVLERFGASAGTRTGVRLGSPEGTPVRAAAGGRVVYAGNDLPHYGLLLIVKHNDTWLSAYGFNSRLFVREGDTITPGQQVATVGRDGRGTSMLHFEIRRDGQPVDPLRYLPRLSN
jgi:lipoprotein NlpD